MEFIAKSKIGFAAVIAEKIIMLYQKTLSPDHGAFSWRYPYGVCRYYPSCSEYSRQAINRYGLVRGLLFTINRLRRCHPWSNGGHDPVK
jgi:putative membrane protein insertion efficiency factor